MQRQIQEHINIEFQKGYWNVIYTNTNKKNVNLVRGKFVYKI